VNIEYLRTQKIVFFLNEMYFKIVVFVFILPISFQTFYGFSMCTCMLFTFENGVPLMR